MLIDENSNHKWQACFAAVKIKLPAQGFFGFTAVTGELAGERERD